MGAWQLVSVHLPWPYHIREPGDLLSLGTCLGIGNFWLRNVLPALAPQIRTLGTRSQGQTSRARTPAVGPSRHALQGWSTGCLPDSARKGTNTSRVACKGRHIARRVPQQSAIIWQGRRLIQFVSSGRQHFNDSANRPCQGRFNGIPSDQSGATGHQTLPCQKSAGKLRSVGKGAEGRPCRRTLPKPGGLRFCRPACFFDELKSQIKGGVIQAGLGHK